MKPIPISLRQITYLLAVADTGSTAAAARAVNVSQPSVSQAVAQMEAHFGQPLFLRLPGQGMQPTPFGRQKLAAFAGLVAQARAALAPATEPDGELTLGAYSTLGPRYAPRLIRAFIDRHPGARITLVEGDLAELAQGLRRGRIDLALVYDAGLPGDLALTPLQAVPPHALVPPDHRLAGAGAVSLADLAQDPVVLINLPHSLGYFLSLFQIAGVTPRIAAETASVEMLRAMVANGLGVGLLATDLPHDLAYDGGRVARLALTGRLLPSRIAIARAAALPPTATASAFLHFCMRAMGNAPGQGFAEAPLADTLEACRTTAP
ncbi:LysR family transcriptional regulator [Paracoccus sediminis]|uniref:DNA-binding transcriptional regulator, LysR family n=1 Tax=Paracoccus sediminis TaxID=1214787 RepID=A0A238WQV0_9RHOB|nr:LysR family transcriptional regulator [Paracoccus sediminis]TBN50384.1 LysR family transcriptional regulator [Paracoccus sediminis]SNR48771.1 DNA-binding transcriptional regulator, LysR family [Paracoccus sediminis]